MNDELLTVDEVAAMIRKPVGTLYYWRSIGRNAKGETLGPDSFKSGSTVVYWRSAVVKYLADQHAASSAHGRTA